MTTGDSTAPGQDRRPVPAADGGRPATGKAAAHIRPTPRQDREFPPAKDSCQVVLQESAIPIRRREPGIPAPLADVIHQALRERPETGFRSAADFRVALEQAS
ncbi:MULTISPECIES: hypothetical protein [Streptomyces]|uniref:hypothetical protein n=1 Tax=Streptomyces TaxID=1883 RepID=UPI002069F87B|nr:MULTISPECIES: hypothetical protein [Streptomyces]UPT40091.1 hypothetical protein MWG59_00855 [Streptomyces sp. WAC00303]WIY74382.1 hypothetical protein QPM16_00830 [Streptomyces anulatus]